eukprot:PhM_4_TR5016/c0_g3_i1/m.53490
MSTTAALTAAQQLQYLPSNAILYRRLIKVYIKKFGRDHNTIIRAWRTTKAEFYRHRALTDAEEIVKMKKAAMNIEKTVIGGIIPVMTSPDRKGAYYKITKETLSASEGHVDPCTGEEFIKKFQSYIKQQDREYMEAKLRAAGKWQDVAGASNRGGLAEEQAKYRTLKSTHGPGKKMCGEGVPNPTAQTSKFAKDL